MIIKTKALVIKEHIVGESDKYVTLFTKEMGKIQAIALNAKKYNGGLATGTQLFVYGEFVLTQYKDTYKLVNVEILEMFHDIRKDLYTLSYGSYIVEFITAVVQEGLESEELLNLTLRTLKALTPKLEDLRLVRSVFELRALSILGFTLQLISCAECNDVLPELSGGVYFFVSEAGGLVCSDCKKHYSGVFKISYSTLYTMRYILSAPLERIYKFRVSQEILKELEQVCSSYMPYYIDKHFKTLDFIHKLKGI